MIVVVFFAWVVFGKLDQNVYTFEALSMSIAKIEALLERLLYVYEGEIELSLIRS